MSSKSKPGLSDIPSNKASPATPKVTRKPAVSKPSKTPSKHNGDSPSPLQNRRPTPERSPRTIGRSSPRVAIPPEKAQPRILRPSELLASAQDELKKTKEKLLLVEKEKAEALSELEEARKSAKDANEKLQEFMVAQKQAEESSEVEKFWAAELEENDGIEPLEKKELEVVGVQHTMDLNFLLSTSEEHQRIKQELAMVTDTKNQALIHADDATKIAEIHAEKVETLSAELNRCKSLLEGTENHDVNKLKSELDLVKQELQIAKGFEKNLAQKEESCEILKAELNSLKEEVERKEESCEQLQLEFESAKFLEIILTQKGKSFIAEIESLNQELIKAKDLQEKLSMAEANYECLKENVIQKDESFQQLSLELEVLKKDLEKTSFEYEQLSIDLEASRIVESYSLNVLDEWRDLLVAAECEINSHKEKVSLLEISLEKKKVGLEESEEILEKARVESSAAAKEIVRLTFEFEQLLEEKQMLINEMEASRVEEEKSKSVIEDLNLTLKSTIEKHEFEINQLKEHLNSESEKKELQQFNSLSDDAKDEIKHLSNMIEKSKVMNESSRHEWEKQKVELMKTISRLEEEKWSMEKEMMRLVNLLREKEKETFKARTCLREALGGEVENNTLKTDLQLHVSKVKELTRLLEQAGDDELSDSEKDYDMLDKEEHSSAADSEPPRMMWESCKIDMEREAEHGSGEDDDDEELDTKHHLNGVQSESDVKEEQQQQQHKKKKPLYRKFGSLLKKGIGNQK